MKTREAIILAGGFGTRLKTVVPDRPKPMAEINGRPFLEYLLDYIISQNVNRCILSVGFRHVMIMQYFGNSYKDAELVYAVEDKPLGTGGGILNALRLVTAETVFIINGDTFFRISLPEMEKEINNKQADMVLALYKVRDEHRYGTVVTNRDGRILKFREKTDEAGASLINGGIYLMKSNIFSGIDFPETFSMEKDFLEKNTDTMKIYGKPFDSDFIDIGIPETYQQAHFFFGHEENEK
jgi:D-glycero-alpha-D-manno-heptose 1-phosphate guanylyltransferase